jgi:L-ascorbate metabolism protein UlaG (beta-lactamase superfamily)
MPYRNPYYDPAKPHHTPEGFRNLETDTRGKGDLQRWRRERKEQGLPKAPEAGYAAFATQWWQPADIPAEGDGAWWLGHACVLLRRAGQTVITDPVLSHRASPLTFAGPARRTPAPVHVDELPRIDVVMISHNHYDHLDTRSVKRIARRFPSCVFVVPLGLAPWMRRHGITNVRELDWWDGTDIDGARFTLVPARHWSARSLSDRNRSLWGGWVWQRSGYTFWFAGDTGYSPNLAEVGRRLGPIDLAALPIGAYSPRWFMQGQHTDPAQAVQLHRESNVRKSLAIHWGVFELADDPLDEPPALLAEALREQGIAGGSFVTIPVGSRLDTF